MGRGGGRGSGILTVGHGTMSGEAFTELVRAAGIERLVDVRSVPGSRRHPQFARSQLEACLPAAGIGYRWEPRLGGFRRPERDSTNVGLRHPSFRGFADYMKTAAFRAGLDEAVTASAVGTTAIMCAETLWWRCHRRLIADAAVLLLGTRVQHLGHDGRLTEHRVTDGARVQGADIVYDRVAGES